MSETSLIERTKDVITGSSHIEDLHVLKSFPVFMGTTDQDPSLDIVADMVWSISRDSGVVQLKHLLPLDLLYQAQTTTSAVGPTWMQHHIAFADFLAAYRPQSVLELGGAHGILALEYHKRKGQSPTPWTILEPNPAPVEGCPAVFIKGFFDESFNLNAPESVLVHSHVFEHMYEPTRFIRQIRDFLLPGQLTIFSVPNLKNWLQRKFTNCINFEHTVFLIEPYVDFLLTSHGFRIIEKRHVMDGHSIFYAAIRDDGAIPLSLSSNLYYENRAIYEDFSDYHDGLTKDINRRIDSWGGDVYLFGAHVFAQYLIAFGLDTKRVHCILDNDVRKQGRRLYGTNLMVCSPEVLRGKKDVAVILKAGIYNEEIKKDIQNHINNMVEYFE